jgi:hypothetical protein
MQSVEVLAYLLHHGREGEPQAARSTCRRPTMPPASSAVRTSGRPWHGPDGTALEPMAFEWQDVGEEVTVRMPVGDAATQDDIVFTLTPGAMTLGVKVRRRGGATSRP